MGGRSDHNKNAAGMDLKTETLHPTLSGFLRAGSWGLGVQGFGFKSLRVIGFRGLGGGVRVFEEFVGEPPLSTKASMPGHGIAGSGGQHLHPREPLKRNPTVQNPKPTN